MKSMIKVAWMGLIVSMAGIAQEPTPPPSPTLEQVKTMAMKEYLAIGSKLQAEMSSLTDQHKKLKSQLAVARVKDPAKHQELEKEMAAIQEKITAKKPKLDAMNDLFRRAKTDNSALFWVIIQLQDTNPDCRDMTPYFQYTVKQVLDTESIIADGTVWVPPREIGTEYLLPAVRKAIEEEKKAIAEGRSRNLPTRTVHLTGVENAKAMKEGDVIDSALVRSNNGFRYTGLSGETRSIESFRILLRLNK